MSSAFKNKAEREAYEALSAEFSRGFRVDSLWLKALLDSKHDSFAAEILYSRWRVEEIAQGILDKERKERERIARDGADAKLRLNEFYRLYPGISHFPAETGKKLLNDWWEGRDISSPYREAIKARQAKCYKNWSCTLFVIIFLLVFIISAISVWLKIFVR